jgi:hypothetical protein
MENDRIITVPTGGTDSATAMAMMNNNPWMYLVMLALFGGGGWGFGGRGGGGVAAGVAANGVLDMETQNKLNSLQAQINDNNNNQWAREAIQGNGFAISQLAQSLGVDYNALQGAINSVVLSINQLGAQNGMGFAGVTNAINLGNLNLVQQLKDCCCATQKQILEQGYQGRIETINQTNDLLTGMRVESGLTRTEIAAFRQAWENARYQDVVADKTRLQTELDLLRTQQGTAAMVAPLQSELQKLEWQMQNFFSTYGTKPAAASGS